MHSLSFFCFLSVLKLQERFLEPNQIIGTVLGLLKMEAPDTNLAYLKNGYVSILVGQIPVPDF
jgi:hypothetical protein